MTHDLDRRRIQKRLDALECRAEQIPYLKARIEKLEAALAMMCQGQQSQDERICAAEVASRNTAHEIGDLR